MLEFEILVKDSFSEKALRVVYDPHSARMPISDEVESYLNKYWQQHKTWAQANRLEVRNEQLLRLVDFGVDKASQEMCLKLSLTDYREFSGTRVTEFAMGRNRSELANPLGAAAVVITADNKILCGQRPPNSNMNPNRYFLIGGFLIPQDLAAGSNLFTGILREIYEETGILPTSHSRIRCTGLVYDLAKPHPELCFSTHVMEKLDTIRAYTPLDNEVVSLEFIDNTGDGIASWLLSLHPIQVVGTAEGCLLLHGLQAFGQDWFEHTLSRLERIS